MVNHDLSHLPPRHQRFVEELAKDWNATGAYRRAGYRARGHSAEQNAYRLRRRPAIAAACAAVLQEQLDACQRVIDDRLNQPIKIRGLGIVVRRP